MTRSLVMALACLAMSGCADGKTAEQYELDNIRPWNEVPRSSPSQFVKAFDRFCLAASQGAARQALRKADYVAAKTRTRGVEAYLVDDTKPAVMLLRGSSPGCAVVAKSRTGQTSRVEDFVAETFPNAIAVDPATLGRRVERAWYVAGTGTVFTQRGNTKGQVTTLLFGIGGSA